MNSTSMTIRLVGLTDEQAKWKPRMGRWAKKELSFFGNWSEAPEDSFYRVIGQKITEAAEKSLKPDYCKWDGEPLGGQYIVQLITDNDGVNIIAEIELRQYLTFDDFNHVPFTVCRIRLTKIQGRTCQNDAIKRIAAKLEAIGCKPSMVARRISAVKKALQKSEAESDAIALEGNP